MKLFSFLRTENTDQSVFCYAATYNMNILQAGMLVPILANPSIDGLVSYLALLTLEVGATNFKRDYLTVEFDKIGT